MDYSKFDSAMYRYLVGWIGLGILFFSVACICLVYIIKNKADWNESKGEKFSYWFYLVLIVCVLIGTPVLVIPVSADVVSDIKNQAYITYEGKFDVVYDQKTPSRQCSIVLPNGRRFDTWNTREEGAYYGCIVYAEKSNEILFVDYLDVGIPLSSRHTTFANSPI